MSTANYLEVISHFTFGPLFDFAEFQRDLEPLKRIMHSVARQPAKVYACDDADVFSRKVLSLLKCYG